jgi:hypothetical protein
MHAAKLSKSLRLQFVLEYLKSRPNGATSMEIIYACRVVAPATVVSELRHQGYDIDCQREGDVWRYRVVA